jgi:Histidine kinase-, DNA gyrase B-, and HSP90-like ATPase
MADSEVKYSERPDIVPAEREFIAKIIEGQTNGVAAFSKLQTDDRVLARITDGIYRQPSSALRELISNAYDADATEVVVETDAPRFREIRIRDNGRGMDAEALARLIHHIGGSSKRTSIGALIGTTDDNNPNLSRKGRKLIGKIGIGLFSVNQLTSHFQIITKVEDADHRLFADVVLKTYSEDELPQDGKFDSGSVQVLSVPADDKDSHGTEIILKAVRPRTRISSGPSTSGSVSSRRTTRRKKSPTSPNRCRLGIAVTLPQTHRTREPHSRWLPACHGSRTMIRLLGSKLFLRRYRIRLKLPNGLSLERPLTPILRCSGH